MSATIKIIIKTFITSSIVFYLTYILITGVNLVIGVTKYGSSNLSFNLFSSAAIFAPIWIIPWAFAYGLIFSMILYVLSLIDEKFLNKWFVVGSTIYISIALIVVFYGAWQINWFYQLCYVLIPLALAIVIIKKEKWLKKSGNENKK